MLSRKIGTKLETSNYHENTILSASVLEALSKADFVIGNLECPITLNGEKQTETSFKAHPNVVNILDSFDYLSLANNHIFDSGKLGAKETIDILRKSGKSFSGIIENKESPIYSLNRIGEKQFALISCAVDDCIKNETDEAPHILKATDRRIKGIISKLKEVKELFIIILIHGGNEMISYPEPSFRNLCRSFIDIGADVIVSNHPHVLGGEEKYKNGVIFYSLGDFIFDGQSFKRRKSGILFLKFENELEWELVPTQIGKDLKTSLSSDEEAKRILKGWNVRTKIYRKRLYEKKYRQFYIRSFIFFQLDRILFLLKHKGLKATFKFLQSKFFLLSFYFRKISKREIY